MESRDRRAIDFAYERQRHAGFVGRADLLARLDQQLIEDAAQRWVVVTGGPGMGKSAVLAAWLARREAAGEIVPHHFIRRSWANWDDPEALVAQLEARVPMVSRSWKPTSAPAESPRSERPEATIAPATGLPRASTTICALPEDANLVTIDAHRSRGDSRCLCSDSSAYRT